MRLSKILSELGHLYQPPTLTSALCFANVLAFGHPLGFDLEKPPSRPRLRVAKVAGEPVAYARVELNREGREVSLRASRGARSLYRELAHLARFASGPGSLLLSAEVRWVNLAHPPLAVELPWSVLAQARERVYVPGIEAYLEAVLAEREGRRQLLLADWRRWEPGEPGEPPAASRMLMLLAKPAPEEGGDGRVFYFLAYNLRGGKW